MNKALLERLSADIQLAHKYVCQHHAEATAKWGNNVERTSVGAMKRILDALKEESERQKNAPVEQSDLCLGAHIDDSYADFDYHRENGNARNGSSVLCPYCSTPNTGINNQCSVLSENGMFSFFTESGTFEASYRCDPQRGVMLNMTCANGHEWTVEISHHPGEPCRVSVQIPEARYPELYPHLREEPEDTTE
jgi:hypothetical protein